MNSARVVTISDILDPHRETLIYHNGMNCFLKSFGMKVNCLSYPESKLAFNKILII
jgi:hypothetical protein